MNAIKEIRKNYKLSQMQLAIYLGVSRSLLALVETGRRDLPMYAFKRFNTLAMAYEPILKGKVAVSSETNISSKEKLAIRKSLKKRLQALTKKASHLQHKLNWLIDAYENANTQAAGIKKLQTVASKKTEPADRKQSLAISLQEANSRMLTSHPQQQFLLEAKLLAIKFESALLSQQLQTAGGKGFVTSKKNISVILQSLLVQ